MKLFAFLTIAIAENEAKGSDKTKLTTKRSGSGSLTHPNCEKDGQMVYWDGLDFPGHDISMLKNFGSIEECVDRCLGTEGCVGFTYARENPFPESNENYQNTCWLKKTGTFQATEFAQLSSGYLCNYDFKVAPSTEPAGIYPVSDCAAGEYLPHEYRGEINVSQSGKTCQKWTVQEPHPHVRTPENYPEKGLGDHNYCRNPDGEEKGAWCYTTDPNQRWEYCTCPDAAVEPLLFDIHSMLDALDEGGHRYADYGCSGAGNMDHNLPNTGRPVDQVDRYLFKRKYCLRCAESEFQSEYQKYSFDKDSQTCLDEPGEKRAFCECDKDFVVTGILEDIKINGHFESEHKNIDQQYCIKMPNSNSNNQCCRSANFLYQKVDANRQECCPDGTVELIGSC